MYGNIALALEGVGTTDSPGYGLDYGPASNSERTSWKGVRCVRDIPVPNDKKEGTKATTYNTESGDSYAMIDFANLPNGIAGTKEMYYYNSGYWSSSQGLSKGEAVWGAFDNNYSVCMQHYGSMTSKYRLRCIKDIP